MQPCLGMQYTAGLIASCQGFLSVDRTAYVCRLVVGVTQLLHGAARNEQGVCWVEWLRWFCISPLLPCWLLPLAAVSCSHHAVAAHPWLRE